MKKLVSLLLMACLCFGLIAGCGSAETPSGGNSDGGNSAAPAQTGGSGTDTPAVPEEDDEPAEIVVAIMCFSPIDTAVQNRIESVVNEKMSEMINVTADFQWYDAVSYMTQIPMMISSGEQLDVMMFTPVPAAGYSAFMGQNQMMDISDYIDAYGPDIKAELGEVGLAATTRGDGIYGVGWLGAHAGGQAIIMRTDVLEAIGKLDDFNSMTTWTEFEDILKAAVAAGYPGLVNGDAEGSMLLPQPFMSGADDFASAKWVDVVGDGNQQIFADPTDNKIKCFYESEDYKNGLIRCGKYYNEGLIYRDASTAQDYADTQIKNGVGVAMTKTLEFGWEGTLDASCGYPMSVRFVDGAALQIATGSFQKFGYAVPVTAKDPAAAVKFINLLYSQNEVHDTLTWGEEGVDWVRSDKGTAVFPEGVENAEYHQMDFLYGDVLTITPWGDDADLRINQRESNKTVKASQFVGFAVDNSPVVNQVTACQSVSNQYKPMLNSGVYGDQTEAKWEEYIAALYSAGMQEIIDEYQSQLDAWLATQ